MRYRNRFWVAGAGMWMLGLAGSGLATVTAVPDNQVVAGTWRNHKARISYFGITSHFTCSGLEDHVKDILTLLGARKDSKVRASGCPGGPDVPSATAWIDADFYTLAPSESSEGPDVVRAYWALREISPRRPFFMDDGDCELVDQLRDTISQSFALKDLEYRTDCTPHEINLNGFRVRANVLVLVPEQKTAAPLPTG